MNLFTAVTTLIALSLFLNNGPAQSFDKQAVSDTQRTLASDLDAELPRLPFTDWLGKVVGPGAGVVWQLSECGERIDAAPNGGGDTQACVEVNSILSDGRKVIVMIAVGTFKKGLTGPPAFRFGVIEQKGELRPIRRLSDLQKLLSGQGEPAHIPAKLPEVNMPSVRLAPNNAYSTGAPLLTGDDFIQPAPIEEAPPEPPPEPPPDRPKSSPPSVNQSQSIQQVVDEVLEGNAITRVEPTYPPTARMVRAFGMVKVQITISETGKVIDAKAISGHQALRSAAVDAAYKWVFKPTTVNGEPIKVQGVLTFNFRSSPKNQYLK